MESDARKQKVFIGKFALSPIQYCYEPFSQKKNTVPPNNVSTSGIMKNLNFEIIN
jgi:hypothetical protein